MNLTIQQHLLTPNPYSRPQLALSSIHKLVVHWVANPNTAAIANRNYFEGLKAGTRGIYASSHFIVGLLGEVIQCIPSTEVAYHAKNANRYSLGIEVCHLDWQGQFSEPTYTSLITLLGELCHRHTLDPQQDILRHYDVTGKVCPKYYVQHPACWTKLKADVVAYYKATYLQLPPLHTPSPSITSQTPLHVTTPLLLNGTCKEVAAFSVQDQYYIKLRDLEDDKIFVDYDQVKQLPILSVKA